MRRVLKLDRPGDVRRPEIRLGASDALHTVALVSEIPRGDRRVILEASDHIAHESRLPADDRRVGEKSLSGEGLGHIHPSAHPSGDKSDDQLDFVFLGEIEEDSEAVGHDRVDSGASLGGVGHRILIDSEFALG